MRINGAHIHDNAVLHFIKIVCVLCKKGAWQPKRRVVLALTALPTHSSQVINLDSSKQDQNCKFNVAPTYGQHAMTKGKITDLEGVEYAKKNLHQPVPTVFQPSTQNMALSLVACVWGGGDREKLGITDAQRKESLDFLAHRFTSFRNCALFQHSFA
eukprot:1152662-Pelagomonas_calceolata.AAC.1